MKVRDANAKPDMLAIALKAALTCVLIGVLTATVGLVIGVWPVTHLGLTLMVASLTLFVGTAWMGGRRDYKNGRS